MKYLLDVSTLVALLWTDHVHHSIVKKWVEGKQLAVCAITELGFIRVSSHPTMGGDMAVVRRSLDTWLKATNPEFVSCDVRALNGEVAPSSGKTTDWYLANLAASKSMKWATLDTNAKHPAAEVIQSPSTQNS